MKSRTAKIACAIVGLGTLTALAGCNSQPTEGVAEATPVASGSAPKADSSGPSPGASPASPGSTGAAPK